MNLTERAHAVADLLIEVYPEPLTVHLLVTNDPEYRIDYMGTISTPEGPYDLTGYLTFDEVSKLDTRRAALLVMFRYMTGAE